MPLCRFQLFPQSPFATPLRSDTITGMLLNLIALRDGETRLKECVASFETDSPEFLLSSAFPQNTLPMPCLPLPKRSAMAQGQCGPELITRISAFKKFRKQRFIPLKHWKKCKDSLSLAGLFSLFEKDSEHSPIESQTQTMSHVSIDRETQRAIDGLLYTTTETFYPQGTALDLYARTKNPEELESLLNDLGRWGYGKRASTGKGQFSVTRDQDFDAKALESEGTHQLCLSVLSAQDMSGIEGTFQTFLKHGRVGSACADGQAFKKPFLAIKEGAVLSSSPCGSPVLRNLHHDERLVHVTAQLSFPCTLATGVSHA